MNPHLVISIDDDDVSETIECLFMNSNLCLSLPYDSDLTIEV